MRRTVSIMALSMALLSLAIQPLYSAAPKKPQWVTKTPAPADAYIGISKMSKVTVTVETEGDSAESAEAVIPSMFAGGLYKTAAKEQACKQIMSSLQLAVESESLFGYMFTKRIYTQSFDDVFMAELMKSPYFTLAGEYEEDDDYWCYFSLKKTDFDMFLQQLEDSVSTAAETYWKDGLAYQEEGALFKAAKCFAMALNQIHPMIFKRHMVRYNYEDVDLYRAIYDSYVNVYSDISFNVSESDIPAVAGEKIPHTFTLSLMQKTKPVRDISIVSEYSDGELSATPVTDANGQIRFSIDKAGKSAVQTISFSIDSDPLFDVPQTYATKQFVKQAFPSDSVKVTLFNPLVKVYVNVEPSDSVISQTMCSLVESREDMMLVSSADSADLVFTAKIESRLDKASVSKEKFNVSQYVASVDMELKSVYLDKVLLEKSIKDFRMMVPGTVSQEKAMHSACREMCRQLKRELPAPFAGIEYDKRQLVWSQLDY